jgi:chromosome partition protein MukB
VAENRAQLDQVDRSLRDARQRLADADEHRREQHRAALKALELMADGPVEAGAAHGVGLQQLRRYRELEALAARLSTIAAALAEARKLASRQAEAREQAGKLGLSLSGQRSARIEITEHLEQAEQERERLLDQARKAQGAWLTVSERWTLRGRGRRSSVIASRSGATSRRAPSAWRTNSGAP